MTFARREPDLKSPYFAFSRTKNMIDAIFLTLRDSNVLQCNGLASLSTELMKIFKNAKIRAT